ncbi:SLC13 family permease [Thioalkalivibrio sp.]|uniref:SLC13 family permease n=1 Tax=Thioalkalivibrio sp. TaxID=2093813 RepID=UPI0035671427
MNEVAFTLEMGIVFGLLGLTILLFVTEVIRIDLAALSVLFLLGMVALVPGVTPIVEGKALFSGFASNAVIAIIAVMIIGKGLDRSGLMNRLADLILRFGGHTERRVMATTSGAVGIITSFMQNIGAAALFMPVINRIGAAARIPRSRLLMPMGFAAIVGGTLTLVASSPLILLNDLLPGHVEGFGLFDVTPVGLALLAMLILYFTLFGKWVLPARDPQGEDPDESRVQTTSAWFRDVYGMDFGVREARLGEDSSLAGRSVGDFEAAFGVHVVGVTTGDETRIEPNRDVELERGAHLAILGPVTTIDKTCDQTGTILKDELDMFARALSARHGGIAEVIIPPGSDLIEQTVRDKGMRRTYGISVLRIQRGDDLIIDEVPDTPLKAGDTLVVHTPWENLQDLEDDRDFVVVTSRYPRRKQEASKTHRPLAALGSLALGLGLVLFTDLPLALALLGGALGMIFTGVINMDEAYRGISWKTVFLLASLIPLGLAVENSGAGEWIATNGMQQLEGMPVWVLQVAVFLLTTFFTLVMSNVGATVLLVPLAVSFASVAQGMGSDADPRVFALIVAIAASNSFILPTHQVNALIMDPGGYRVVDYLRAGAGVTVLFMVVSLLVINLLF